MNSQRQEILDRGSYFPGDWVRPRYNPGTWMAMVDVMEIFTGHRSTTRGGSYELFDGPIGVKLKVEEARRSEPFLMPEKEWELDQHMSAYHVWHDDGKLHLIYGAGSNACYAVSDDGYNWDRPVLGEAEFNGSADNNILKAGVQGSIIEDPSAAPAERFKALGAEGFWLDRDSGEEVDADEADGHWRAEQYEGEAYTGRKVVLKGALVGYTSPDRLHWTKIEERLASYSVNGGICPGYDAHNETFGGIHLTGVTICSVHGVSSRWQALPGLGWRVSSLVSNRCGLPGLPRMAAVARRLRLSELRPRRRLALGRWPLHVSGVFDTQFGDGRYDLRSDADTLDDMVHRLLAVRHR